MSEHEKSGFVWYELMTSGDLDGAAEFYGKVVGWDIRDSGMPGMQYLLFGKDGKDVGGMVAWSSMGMNKPTTWKGHIFTRDVDAETKAVVADGGTEFRPPQDIPGVGRFSVVGDPQGAEYLLFQPNETEAPQRLTPEEPGAAAWCELVTTDWEKAWDYYSGHYGWAKETAVPMGEMGTYQTFTTSTTGGGMMNIAPFMQGRTPSWTFYFTVDSINAAAQRVKDAGGTVTHGPVPVPGGAFILQGIDPQGGPFALTGRS